MSAPAGCAPTCPARGYPASRGIRGSLCERLAGGAALHLADRECIQASATGDQQESSMKQLVQRPVRSSSAPNSDRQHEAAKPADHADEPADRADMVGIVDRDVLEDRRLAERHEEAEHEHRRR